MASKCDVLGQRTQGEGDLFGELRVFRNTLLQNCLVFAPAFITADWIVN